MVRIVVRHAPINKRMEELLHCFHPGEVAPPLSAYVLLVHHKLHLSLVRRLRLDLQISCIGDIKAQSDIFICIFFRGCNAIIYFLASMQLSNFHGMKSSFLAQQCNSIVFFHDVSESSFFE